MSEPPPLPKLDNDTIGILNEIGSAMTPEKVLFFGEQYTI